VKLLKTTRNDLLLYSLWDIIELIWYNSYCSWPTNHTNSAIWDWWSNTSIFFQLTISAEDTTQDKSMCLAGQTDWNFYFSLNHHLQNWATSIPINLLSSALTKCTNKNHNLIKKLHLLLVLSACIFTEIQIFNLSIGEKKLCYPCPH